MSKTICVDVEFIDAPLDYNILLGHSYTYAMSVVPSVVHPKMSFPHNGNIVTIYQLTYYKPKWTSPRWMPLINEVPGNVGIPDLDWDLESDGSRERSMF